tara:strand:+ start:2133 stop:2735 length:603 start_codon:yes stop_codon:yes gene_type:complete
MTPSKLIKLNFQYFKYFILTILLSTALSFFISTNYTVKIINKYEIIVVEDLNTKYLIDKIYNRDNNAGEAEYYKYLKNYVTSEFLMNENDPNIELDISRTGNYSISKTFLNEDKESILSFEKKLKKHLKEKQITINKELSSNYEKNFGALPNGVQPYTKLFFNKESKKKGSKPFTIYFTTIIIGIIILNFIIILDNPPKK